MFYNSKKLIDEKVLQQYFFELFMLADQDKRVRLLPASLAAYAPTNAVKCLNPEVKLGSTAAGTDHCADFVLYAIPGTKLPPLNVEIKWNVEDFEKQSARFPYYDGSKGSGFVVAIAPEDPKKIRSLIGPAKNIPVVYLDAEDFKQWFIRNSYIIISQTFANKLGATPARLTGPRIWVVALPKSPISASVPSASEHYLQYGRSRGIWAFRDNNSPRNIINILQGDLVIFVRLGLCKVGRSVWAHPTSHAKTGGSKKAKIFQIDDDWNIDMLDIRVVKHGYHLNFSGKKPYDCFDAAWKKKIPLNPATKEYTQFITFEDKRAPTSYLWRAPVGVTLGQKLFPYDKANARAFVNALRTSSAQRGDAIEICNSDYQFVRNLLSGL